MPSPDLDLPDPSLAHWVCKTAVDSPFRTFIASALLAVLTTITIFASYAAACAGGSIYYTPPEGYTGDNPTTPNIKHVACGKPIDCATGNQWEIQNDLEIEGHGPPLELTRYYNSQLAATQSKAGSFGYGWTSTYSATLEINKEAKTATIHQDNGSDAVFFLSGETYSPKAWSQAKLIKEGENYIFIPPDQTEWEFNSSGRLTNITERHGLSLTLKYNGSNQLESVADATGRKLSFTYKEGKVESVKDPMGHVVKYTYESGNLSTVTLPGDEKARWKFGYNASHEMTSLTDGRGNKTTTEYDGSHRATSQTEPLERKRTFEYKETEGVKETKITHPNGSVTLKKFNSVGEPTSITHTYGTELAATTTFEYDDAFRLIAETDPNEHKTSYTYDSEGNRLSEKDPNGNETKWTYNGTHDIESITIPKGKTTAFGVNASGDIEWIVREGPGETYQETYIEYNEFGEPESITDPLERTTTYEYDSKFGGPGKLMWEIDPAGNKTSWGYNTNAQVVSEISPRGNEKGAEWAKFKTTIERDEQGRPKTITDPLGHETKYKYDAAGNLEVLTNPNGHTTTYVYDAANQRTEVKAANGDVSKTAYDSMGQVKSKTDGNGNTTKYERNLLGQITELIDPLERKTTKKYDDAGNLEEVKDPEGRTTTYIYDAGDRLEKVNYSEEGTPDVTFKYDKDGNVTEMIDGTGTTKKTYDDFGRLTEVENGNKEVVKYEYNLANEITKLTYPNGKSITRTFDKAGRLEKVTDWLGKETKFAYNPDSALTSTTFPSASENKDEYEYNAADQLTKTAMKRGAETLASIAYARDSLGLVKSATQTGLPGAEKPEYEYDERERLKAGAGTEFKYDAANSLTKLGSTTLKYDKASQLEEAGTTKYVFDKLGQRTEAKPASGPVTKYGYNQAGNLVSVNRTEEGEVKKIEDTYTYDGSGLRASQKISGTKAQFVWDISGGLPLLLYDGTNYYIYGPDGLPSEQIASETATYLHHDHLGSTRLITNATGEAKGKYTYTPYGAVEGQSGVATTPLGFNGQYRNESTGLIYLRARTYDPVTAQFLSPDPLATLSGETYAYAAANPTNVTDATGLIPTGCSCPPPPCPPGQQSSTVPQQSTTGPTKDDEATDALKDYWESYAQGGLNGYFNDKNKFIMKQAPFESILKGGLKDGAVSAGISLFEAQLKANGFGPAAAKVNAASELYDAWGWASLVVKSAGWLVLPMKLIVITEETVYQTVPALRPQVTY